MSPRMDNTIIRVQHKPYGETIDTIGRKPFWYGNIIAIRYRKKLYRLAGGVHTTFFISLNLPLGR